MDGFSFDEQAAASAVAALGGKRDRDDSPDAAGGVKKSRADDHVVVGTVVEGQAIAPVAAMGPVPPPAQAQGAQQPQLQPFPYFYYRDFSKEVDPDPLTPLTPPGRVPNFPAKMHSILSRPDLADVISWMPHGRSWRVLKPREFEVRVIPTYFEHAKFSSFVRQANGWGFRRITQGRDRNSYYHELFLRGLPHLSKKMKRPGVAKKQAADPEHEPDLYNISEMNPVPEKSDDDSILLQCTLQGGPKARMPIYSGHWTIPSSFTNTLPSADTKGPTASIPASVLPPRDQQAMSAFQQALGASESQFKNMNLDSAPSAAAAAQQVVLPQSNIAAATPAPANILNMDGNKVSPLTAANNMAFNTNNMAAAFQATNAASQFAAGFAAAAALSHQQLRAMLGQIAAQQQQQLQPPQQQPQEQSQQEGQQQEQAPPSFPPSNQF